MARLSVITTEAADAGRGCALARIGWNGSKVSWARSCSMRLLTSMCSVATSPAPHDRLVWYKLECPVLGCRTGLDLPAVCGVVLPARALSSAVSKPAFVRCQSSAPNPRRVAVGRRWCSDCAKVDGVMNLAIPGSLTLSGFTHRWHFSLPARNCRAGDALRLHAVASSQTALAVREHGAAEQRGT